MNKIYWDIETAPLPESEVAHLAPEFEAPGNIKDPEKIKAAIAAKAAAWLEKLALDPLTGSICAIGCLSDKPWIGLASESSEKAIIEQFWAGFSKNCEGSVFIGFNIVKFDLPFLIIRSWKLGIPIPLGVRNGRYFSDTFIDLMETYQLGNRQEYISLDTLAKYLSVGEKNGNGADFHKLPVDQQKAYLLNDLKLTEAIAGKILGW